MNKNFRSSKAGALNGSFDMDTLSLWLKEASIASVDFLSLQVPKGSNITLRWGIRALVALTPETNMRKLADRVQFILGNTDFSVAEIARILKGNKDELTIEELQNLGHYLREGYGHSKIAELTGQSRNTVAKLDSFLGVSIARKDKLIALAIECIESGAVQSGKELQEELGLNQAEARKIYLAAIDIMKELA